MLLRAAWGEGKNELCALDKEKSVAAPSEFACAIWMRNVMFEFCVRV